MSEIEKVLRAEVECLRKVLAEKDKKIAYLEMQLDYLDKEYSEVKQEQDNDL